MAGQQVGQTPIEHLRAAVDALADGGGAGVSEEDLLVLLGQLGRLEVVAATAARRFATDGAWAADGSRTAAAWLAYRLRVAPGRVARQLRLGEALEVLPHFGEGGLAGTIGVDHIEAVDRIRRRSIPAADRLREDEELLAGQAAELRYQPFLSVVKYWEQHADPDGTLARFDRQHERRQLTLGQTVDDDWFGQFRLDPIGGTIVDRELRRISGELYTEDRNGAAEQLGRRPLPDELGRTPRQRRADALVEMARRSSLVRPELAGHPMSRPGPLFTILVGYETLHGRISELENGTVIPPGALLRWLDTATFERAVFQPDNRVEVSERARFFTGARRRAVQVRDRTCRHPTCDEPLERCQVDHRTPDSRGGRTTQENGRLLCSFHNRLRNNLDWDATWPDAGGGGP